MYIKVEVVAGVRDERVEEKGPTAFVISVREKAENNAANRRVLEIIRKIFGNKNISVRIVSGHHSSRKILSVDPATDSGVKR